MADRADSPDPQVQMLLETMAATNAPPTYGVTPEVARQQFAGLAELGGAEAVAETQEFDVEGPGGALPVRAYLPEGDGSHPIVVFFHGGGYVIGSLDTHDNVCHALSNRADALVLSVDYRLAPEHPFPAALEDGYAAVEWAAEHCAALGGDPDRLAVAGDSAGGNLAAGVSLAAADRGGPAIAHQLLVYPWIDPAARREFDSYQENAEGYFLEMDTIEWFADNYLQRPSDLRNEYAAPLLARDLSGLPPATIVTAGYDPLRDEGEAYAERLAAAGVDVEHVNYEGMIHAFVSMLGVIDRADDAVDLLAGELRDSVGTT